MYIHCTYTIQQGRWGVRTIITSIEYYRKYKNKVLDHKAALTDSSMCMYYRACQMCWWQILSESCYYRISGGRKCGNMS